MTASRRLFLALDAGTGGGKCAVFDAAGRRLGASAQPWSYRVTANPQLPFVKEFEFDAEEFWQILCRAIGQACREARVERHELIGVGTTSQREGCVFLNARGDEIYAGPNLDARGFREGLEVIDKLGSDRLYQITGHSPPFIFPLARYLWHRKQRTETVAHTLMISDWIAYRLSGAIAGEPSNATESMFFDLCARSWSDEMLRALDIPASILPSLQASGAQVGTLTAAAAEQTGLPAGLPVYLGGADTQCSLLGAGLTAPGETGATLGTTTPVQMILERPVLDPQCNLWAGCHVVPDRWVLESNAGDTGAAYLWLLNLLGEDRQPPNLFQMGEDLARTDTPPQVYTFIGPTVFNIGELRPDKAGGILFPFPALHFRPQRADLVRSFLDSVGFAIRANCEQIAAVTGTAPAHLTLSGGLSRSRALVQRVANTLGAPVRVVEEPESAALGCAILIAAGAGFFPSIEGAARAMVRAGDVPPSPGARERCEPLYAKWRELYDQLGRLSV